MSPAAGQPLPRGEKAVIDRIRAALPPVAAPEVGIGDDAAVVSVPGGGLLLLAADVVVAGVHVDLSFCSPADVGWKSLAVNVSDVAAMGGRPLHALVSVVCPPGLDLDGLYDGLIEAAAHYGCAIVGGDLSSGSDLAVSVAVTGTTDGRPAVLRSGARVGDTLFVSGPLGSSAAGLALLRAGGTGDDDLKRAHRRPEARLAEGVVAARCGATAMIDVSDGLATDLDHLATASGVGVELETVPVAGGARLEDALGGGEDYELVFAAPDAAAVAGAFAGAGLRLPVLLGRCVGDPAARLLEGRTIEVRGYEHRLG